LIGTRHFSIHQKTYVESRLSTHIFAAHSRGSLLTPYTGSAHESPVSLSPLAVAAHGWRSLRAPHSGSSSHPPAVTFGYLLRLCSPQPKVTFAPPAPAAAPPLQRAPWTASPGPTHSPPPLNRPHTPARCYCPQSSHSQSSALLPYHRRGSKKSEWSGYCRDRRGDALSTVVVAQTLHLLEGFGFGLGHA